jgi:hypothetical protein
MSFKSIGSIGVGIVSWGNISGLGGFERLLSVDSRSGISFVWNEGSIRWTKWVLSIHSIKSSVSDSLEWSSSSVLHVDLGGGIVPFFGVSGKDIISVVLGDHSVVLQLEFLLSGGSGSWGISGSLPGSSGFIWSLHKSGVSDSLEWSSSSVLHVDLRSGILPFLSVSSGNIISIVLGDHFVVLKLILLLLGSSGSWGISGVLPGSSWIIWGNLHVVFCELIVESSSWNSNSVNVVWVGRSFISSWHKVLSLFGRTKLVILLRLNWVFWLTLSSRGSTQEGDEDAIFHDVNYLIFNNNIYNSSNKKKD